MSQNSFGLEDKALALIKNTLSAYPEITQAKIFGSRALGNFKTYSDIDLVLFGEISLPLLATLNEKLENLPLAYNFDTKLYSQISHEPLREHIDKFGIDINVAK